MSRPVPRPSPPAPARAALACLLLVVLAGCSVGFTGDPTATDAPTPEPTAAPAATPTTTATPDRAPGPTTGTPDPSPTPVDVDAPDLTVTGGELPVDAGRAWALTMRLLGTEDTERPAVAVEESMPSVVPEPPAFARRLGLEARGSELEAAAYVRDPGTVHVNQRILDRPVVVEYTLAHEYVHVVQFRLDAFDRVRGHYEGTPDGTATARGVTEGTAVYAADVYWQRHLARGPRPAEDVERIHREASGYTWYVASPYYFGHRYAAARLDDPAAIPEVYDDPPRTTEELIHRLPPGSEPPADLRVRVADGEDGWRERASHRARMGELFVRAVLRTELDDRRAARGADGWGNDTRLAFTREGRDGYAWVLRWDDRANATEFEAAFRAYLDGRATRAGDGWRNGSTAYRVERAGDRTTVIYAGAPAFVENATADLSGGTVTVRPSRRAAAGATAAQSVRRSGTAKVTTSPTARMAKPTPTSLVE